MDGLMDGYSADRRLGRQWTLGRATDGRVTSRRRDELIDGHKTEGVLDKVQMDSQVLERADEGKWRTNRRTKDKGTDRPSKTNTRVQGWTDEQKRTDGYGSIPLADNIAGKEIFGRTVRDKSCFLYTFFSDSHRQRLKFWTPVEGFLSIS